MYCVKRSYGNTHYVCGAYQKRGAHHCTRHPIREKYLEQLILNDLKQFMGDRINTDELMDDVRAEVEGEKKRTEKEVVSLKKKIEKLESRKSTAEDKWLDGEWDKERYHQVLERLEKELFEVRQRLNKLLKDQESTKLTLPDIAKLTNLDQIDRELVLLLVKRIHVSENGKVAITYNFTE
jgi:site-specific DNA recombinase